MPVTKQAQFKEVNATGAFVCKTKANYADSMALLQQNNLRALTYPEALVLIDRNPDLKEHLKDQWFYLEGKGILDKSGCYAFDNLGNLSKVKGDPEKTVYIYSGTNPLSLVVRADGRARVGVEGRFDLGADYDPQDVASVVVGVRIGHEVATPKIEASEVDAGGVTLPGITPEELMTLLRNSEQELSKVAEAFGPDSLSETRKLVAALRIKD